MEIINYQIAPLRASFENPLHTAVDIFRPAIDIGVNTAELAITAGRAFRVLKQYKILFGMILAGAVCGFGLAIVDDYSNTYAPSFDISRFSILERANLESDLERFFLSPDTLSHSGNTADADELSLFTADSPAAGFVFTEPVGWTSYTVQRGDTISGISVRFSLNNISTLISANNIDNVRHLAAGQRLRVPSLDGILHDVQKGDTLEGLSVRYTVALENLLDVNDLSTRILQPGQQLFIPGAQLDASAIRRAMGELFAWPLSTHRITSWFGYRTDPFTGTRIHHNGLDMGAPTGTSVRSAMSGRVASTGYSNIYGNFVIVNHGNGYQTMYGHLSKILVRQGQAVAQGGQIGQVGNTGRSTAPHLHFTVYRNGKLVNPTTVLR
ncbi:MAG: M23 family metallopeptidase [Spirochaetaceae bacterium]|jgi:murein DD-endopeptidase MepM/ murein hydrolase activator NlpD|nr:M23 family metallopeptidase [Spirochaetaceae bacterium]